MAQTNLRIGLAEDPDVLTVAGDAREGGSGTIAWPLRPSEGVAAPPAMVPPLSTVTVPPS